MTATLTPINAPVTAVDRLEIVVTLADIQDGLPGLHDRCALALALQRAGHRDVSVLFEGVHADGRTYRQTQELKSWIAEFDDKSSRRLPERFVLLPAD